MPRVLGRRTAPSQWTSTPGRVASTRAATTPGGTNVEAVTPKVVTARERVPKHLKADYEKIASLVPSSALE
ncbi:hypothetical protein E4U58_000705, partial [Claviceps cyperi]